MVHCQWCHSSDFIAMAALCYTWAMDTSLIQTPEWRTFYHRWRDMLRKTQDAVAEVREFELDVDDLVVSLSREVWVAVNMDLAKTSTERPPNLHKMSCYGVKMRPIHMELVNQVVVQCEGIVLVARLFHIPSPVDVW